MMSSMQRRSFLTLLGGTAAAWPLAARAQQRERVRRIGVLMNLAADDPEGPPRVAAFAQGLQEFGWDIGRKVQVDYRWVGGQVDSARRYASELIALAPDLILASGALTVAPLQQGSRTIPIVFVSLTNPIAATASVAAATHRNWIIALAARHRLPAVYPFRDYVAGGGLISYGPDTTGQFRRAASYVDRILCGEKPADLPVQAPVKYETVLNMKTARALGLNVPPQVLALADEVIE